MSFTGTLDKCKTCDKTVYFVDLLTADGVTYHKASWIFKLNEQLLLNGWSPLLQASFRATLQGIWEFQQELSNMSAPPSKVSSIFTGTQDKCRQCSKTVYPLEKITMEGEPYHKSCFKCAHGGCPLTHSSYAALDGILYCKHHFAQLFMEKGNYTHVLEAANRRSNAKPEDVAEPAAEEEGEGGGAEDEDGQAEPPTEEERPPEDD
ncbi:hypothetical protein L2E82_14466 [Cichorium intybus]|uniref:Uncharacterized protein n=1 Tax=Cichorium intybus TaxID=13427 RepID=A0ACB9F1C8_CICIN|nr:hypothetical protein L2E82_14466 [Cichorium intybus]